MSLLTETAVIAERGLRRSLRSPVTMATALAQPLVWLLLFTAIFRQVGELPVFRDGGYGDYIDFATAGILVMSVLISGLLSGMGMSVDLMLGSLEKFVVAPVSRLSILFGRMLADGVRMAVQTTLLLLVAWLLGAPLETGAPGAVLIVALVTLFGVAVSSASDYLALKTRSAEATAAVANFLLLPVLFLSSALIPTDAQPRWAELVSRLNPMNVVLDAVRGLMNDGYDLGSISRAVATTTLLAALFVTAAQRSFLKSL